MSVQVTGTRSARANESLELQALPIEEEDLVNLLNISSGALSPISGFMGEADCGSVLRSMRMADDTPWAIPVLLRTKSRPDFSPGDDVLLTIGGRPAAVLEVSEVFRVDRRAYARSVYGTLDPGHPGVVRCLAGGVHVVAGTLKLVFRDGAGKFEAVTLAPRETRVLFKERGWKDIIAFQTRNTPHLGHEYLQKTGLALADGVFINPVIGRKKAGDFRDEVIVGAYQALIRGYYPPNSVVLSVLHYEMQYAGPKEAIMHAIIRKNFGCTMIAIGRDHAGVGSYYGPYAAHEIFAEFPDLGIRPVLFREFYYCRRCAGIANDRICPHGGADRVTFSGTQLRKLFLSGRVPPPEFMRPEVAEAILKAGNPFVE